MSEESCSYLAVLGDLHGHLTLAYRILRRWELETGRQLAAILQVGDLGAFPPPFRLDRATLRFSKQDPDELGFAAYFEPSAEADAVLGPKAAARHRIDAPMYFVAGNHEDFEFLAELSGWPGEPVAVDAYGRIFYLASGGRYRLELGSRVLEIGALGGIARQGRGGDDPVSPIHTRRACQELDRTGAGLDILLTHDAPYGAIFEQAGSRDILEFLVRSSPSLHFFGHQSPSGVRGRLSPVLAPCYVGPGASRRETGVIREASHLFPLLSEDVP